MLVLKRDITNFFMVLFALVCARARARARVCVSVSLNNLFLRKPSIPLGPVYGATLKRLRWLGFCTFYCRTSNYFLNLAVALKPIFLHLFCCCCCCCSRCPVSGLLYFTTNTINVRPSIKGQWIFTHYPCYNTFFSLFHFFSALSSPERTHKRGWH